jgi:hypothetical protein
MWGDWLDSVARGSRVHSNLVGLQCTRFRPLPGHESCLGTQAPETEKPRPSGAFLTIGAPRFELGTSSPPDCFRLLAGIGETWREVA